MEQVNSAVDGKDPYVKDTPTLIASDKVEGTAVYGVDGDRIGSIQRIILEKRGGRRVDGRGWRLLGHRRRLLPASLGKAIL